MEYRVIRSKRRTLSLSVERGGKLVVRAPLRISEKEIEAFVARHALWAQRKIERRSVLPTFCDGDTLSLLGRSYRIASGPTAIENETLFLPASDREAALIALLKKLARVRMQRLVDELCKAHRFTYAKLAITSARTRWGSCGSNGHISFTFRSSFLPDDLAMYLAVHELCHTRHMDHSAAFWREVEKILPDYAARRRALKSYQWAMDCL